MNFRTYTDETISGYSIAKLAKQYDGIDMAKLMGADENTFPFLISENNVEKVFYWYSPSGCIMQNVEDDPVLEYATLKYLKENAYPIFESLEAAENHAKAREWPSSKV